MQVFDLAQIQANGRTLGENSPVVAQDAEDAKNILRQFQTFHKSWFPSQVFREATGTLFDKPYSDVFSTYEIANLVSYIMLTNQPYENLVTGNQVVKELREGQPGRTDGPPSFGHTFKNAIEAFTDTLGAAFSPLFLEVGRLRGIAPLSSGELSQTIRFSMGANNVFPSAGDPYGVSYTNVNNNDSRNEIVEIPYRKSIGAGGIGSPSYLILNMDGVRNLGLSRATGGNITWRRLVTSVYRDIMCRSLPVVNSGDANSYVRLASTLPYRSNSTCMSCHASIDGGAAAFRNLSLGEIASNPRANPNGFEGGHNVVFGVIEHPTAYTAVTAPVTPPSYTRLQQIRWMKREGGNAIFTAAEADIFSVDYDNQFFKRVPNGKVFYRDINNQLIDQNVQGVEAFGQTLAQIDDLYVCAAKRYFRYMTGYDASMLEVPNSSEAEVAARDFVVEIGKRLKSHQSLRDLIAEIIQSDYFKDGVQ